jgi:Bacterial Ig-like domain (group 2)
MDSAAIAEWIIVVLLVILAARDFMDREEKKLLKELLHCCELNRLILVKILNCLCPGAQSAKGELMPARIVVGGNGAKFTFTEYDGPNGTGNVVAPSGPITYASDNTAVATVDSNGNVTAVAANADGSDATCNISGLDPASTNMVTASDVCTVGAAAPPPPPVAVSATGVLTANP